MTTELPVYLLPDFDPSKVKVAELRGILLAHGIIYNSNAKKSELVALFKSKIIPLIPRLIREHAAVRASDDGVLDGNSLDGSLRELDTDPEEFPDSDHSSLTSKKHTKKTKSKRKSMVGRAHEAAEAQEEGEVTEKRRKGRKSVRMSSKEPEYEEIPDQHDVIVPLAGEGNASPKKRKAAAPPSGDEGTPRTASILKSRRSTIQSEGEGGFSDYNPFQSGGEETPGRDPKRRKSSSGVEKLKERKSTNGFERSSPPLRDDDPAPPTSSRKSTSLAPPIPSPAKPSPSTSRPDLTTSNSWSSATPEEARQRLLDPDRYKSSPATSSSSRSTPISTSTTSKGKARESVATPIGTKYMVPIEKVKTTPPETQRLMREYEAVQRRETEEKRRLEREEEELRREREEKEMEMEVERDDLGDVEMDPIEDVLEEEMDIVEQDEFEGEEQDPFQGGGEEVELEEEDDFEGEEDSLFEEDAPPPPKVVAALRQASTPRRSEALPYSPRQAQAQALAQTPRRSLPFPTPPSSVVTKQRRPSSKLDQTISLRPTSSSLLASNTARTVKHVSTWSLLLLTIIYSLWWREEKLSAGFCDTNSSFNSLVLNRQTSLALPQLPSSLCTTLSALHLRPSCTPCPTHGHCESSKFIGCTLDYVPRSSPLRLGGLIPVPPKCVPDTEKLMVVAMQASRASKLLRKRRGEVVCTGGVEGKRRKIIAHGGESGKGQEDREAFVFGLQAESVLSALLRENEASKSPFSEEVLEELNRLALSDLVNHGEVLTWQDGEDYWYASKTAEMPLSCQARLAAIKSAKKHKTGLAGILSALLSMLYLRYKLQARVQEKQRVAELVQTALVQLQRQERAHHADPVHVPFAHIAPSQLRDLVLQHVHSPTRRAQLWKRVEKVVEGNSNVRVMEVEQNGEELRGWQWVGATGAREIESGQSSPEKVMVERIEERPMMEQKGKKRIFGVL